MSPRENFPNQRKYSTFTGVTTTAPSLLKRITDILSCLSNGIDSATEIAEYCNYSISTVHRLLQNLAELDWVVQDASSRRYFLGPVFAWLSRTPGTTHRYLVLHALKEMYQLSDLTEETVNLGILNKLRFENLYDVPSRHSMRIIEESYKYPGQYVGATAKVLLSQLDDKELLEALRHIRHDNLTNNTVTDNEILLAQIREIRQNGYSISFGERIRGYHCPVALFIVGPEDRLKPGIDGYTKELIASAQRISEDIAGVFGEQGGPAS
jgi:DNA-binding IclR family transcriptional regulator